MKDIIAKGHLMYMFCYFILGICFLISLFCKSDVISAVKVAMTVYFVISSVLIIVLLNQKNCYGRMHNFAYLFFYSVLVTATQLIWNEHETIIAFYMMIWIVSILFLDKFVFVILGILQTVDVAFVMIAGESMNENAIYDYRDFLITVILSLIATWICRNIAGMFISVYNENVEHEQSLDDMIAIVKDKHNEAIEANKSKSLFLSNMSHEIRTPINTILGMNEMIIREEDNPVISDYAMSIKDAGDLLLSIVNDILDFSKIEAGMVNMIYAEYQITDVIKDAYNMMATPISNKNLDFILDIDENLPTSFVGDDTKLYQIVVNLLNNAKKYTHTGFVKLSVSGKSDGGDYYLHISVSDSGIGVKKEDLEKLQESFVRVDEKRNKNVEGTGLGLAIVRSYLEIMGADLNIESEYEKGSAFSFDIKQMVTDYTPIGDFNKILSKARIRKEYNAMFYAPDARVLVVDDNENNLKVITALLKETGVNLDTASDGDTAIAKAHDNKYDLIFMDHMMPGTDGITAFHRIREDESSCCRETPIVVLTANAIAGAQKNYIEEGFNDYLTKPIIPENLEKMVLKHLDAGKISDKGKKNIKIDNEDNISNLPDVEGLDYRYGMLHMNNEELLKETILLVKKSLVNDSKYLENCIDKIKQEDKESLDDFRIRVHSMKSSANMIGLFTLAGYAALLEYAARDNNIEGVIAATPLFLDSVNCVYNNLEKAFPENNDAVKSEEKKAGDAAVLNDYLSQLDEAMTVLDIDSADNAIKKIKEYTYSDEINDVINNLDTAVTNLEIEKVLELTAKIRSFMEDND